MKTETGWVLVCSAVLTACFDPAPPAETPSGLDTDSPEPTTTGTDPGTTSGPSDDTGSGDQGDGESGEPGPCATDPCQNGGTCIELEGGFECECPGGYSGDQCEIAPEDPCEPNPCDNDGICTADGDGFTCECAEGWDGDICDVEIDECMPNPCQNGGVCTDEVGGFTCECAPGFEGDACETNIDDCAPNPCQNGGMCIDGIESFECNCGGPFEGDLCECSISPPTQVDYTSMGTFQAPALYDPPGVTVTGSAAINVLNLNGLGIVGGIFTNTIDGNEWIEFEFDDPSTQTSYFVNSAGNQNGDGFVGAATVEAFDEMGASLGTVPVNGTGVFNLNALFGPGRLTRFRVTANVDNHRIANVSVSPVVCN